MGNGEEHSDLEKLPLCPSAPMPPCPMPHAPCPPAHDLIIAVSYAVLQYRCNQRFPGGFSTPYSAASSSGEWAEFSHVK